ncbi:MAG TPA: hypothetical protein VFJ98_05315 [Mycobacteriales bacterium]|nr:hypothetical protein [Mycobacteriales bacterium]
MFLDELRTQREHATVLLHQAELAGDDVMAGALRARLEELSDIASRNGVRTWSRTGRW